MLSFVGFMDFLVEIDGIPHKPKMGPNAGMSMLSGSFRKYDFENPHATPNRL